MIHIGDRYETEFIFSQNDVQTFAELTGDYNPLHLDEEYAAQTPFKQPIIHGMLSASVFSRVFGMEFPGEGSIYVSQNIRFKRPMYVDHRYVAGFEVTETDTKRGNCIIACTIKNLETGKVVVEGEAEVKNPGEIQG